MNYFKLLFFVTLLSVCVNSHAESEASVSVMDAIDRGEDYYFLISKKIRAFFCGAGNQEMDTSIGRLVKSLLCSKKNSNDNEVAHISEPQVKKSSLSLSGKISDFSDIEFVTIKPDSFIMGSPEGEEHRHDDEDQVEVTISRAFEIMRTEVTQEQWFNVMKVNPSYFNQEKYCKDSYREINTIYLGRYRTLPQPSCRNCFLEYDSRIYI